MRFDATVQEIRALVQLAEFDAQAQDLPPERLRARRGASQTHLAGRLLDRYLTLLESGRSPVVVAIEGGSCSGCHVRLPTMVEYQARRGPAVHTCPHCRRMLYAPALLGEERARGRR
jgi:predicted  nucleic acid-binding Zn-ribbon protein